MKIRELLFNIFPRFKTDIPKLRQQPLICDEQLKKSDVVTKCFRSSVHPSVRPFCQAQPKPKLNLAGLSLALFFISPTAGRLPDKKAINF